ncbi:hypothetical protein BDY21DRAFT_176144 [Lineolata rhizophorae]|uniref:Uncharacterized protein n=1 Tax=Lineolata rhizophorae TaxID=578093 RepID=A0A6A6NKQ7_9PEZI|nr:hypothetical protein BDY21DRAFT_176144 [Lineolata rhizophorae]
MASSCSISSLAPSFPMKIFPYVPRAPKPKPKSKAKSMATTKTAEHSSLGVGSSSKDDGEWFHIDDFPMPDSDASCSLAPANASGSLDHDVVGGLSAASESEKPEHYQSGRKSLDGGTNHATSVAKTNSALNRLFDGSSLEFPIILESDAAEKHYSTTQVKPSNGASDHQGNSHHAAADTGGYGAGQHDDLDAASMRALSEEGMEGIRHEPSLAEDEPLDIDVTSRSPLTGKRTRRSSGDTIISSAEVPEVTPELELEGHRSAKRRRPAEQGAECLILDPVSTSKSTSPPTPGGSVSCSRTSNDSSPCPLDSASKSDGARSPVLPLNDVLDVENSSGCAHDHGTGEEPLHFLRRSISPFEGIQGDQDIGPDSDRREEKSNASDDEVGESHEDKRNRDDGVSCGESVTASRQCEPSSQRFRKKRRGLSRTALGQRNRNTMPLRGGRQTQRQHGLSGNRSHAFTCAERLLDRDSHCPLPRLEITSRSGSAGSQAPRWRRQSHPHDPTIAGFMDAAGIPIRRRRVRPMHLWKLDAAECGPDEQSHQRRRQL